MTSIWSKSNRLSGKKTSQCQKGAILEGCIVIRCDTELVRKADAALYNAESHWFLLWTMASLSATSHNTRSNVGVMGEGDGRKGVLNPTPLLFFQATVLHSVWLQFGDTFVIWKPTLPSLFSKQVCSHQITLFVEGDSLRGDWKVLSNLYPSSLLRWLSIIIILPCIY